MTMLSTNVTYVLAMTIRRLAIRRPMRREGRQRLSVNKLFDVIMSGVEKRGSKTPPRLAYTLHPPRCDYQCHTSHIFKHIKTSLTRQRICLMKYLISMNGITTDESS